MSINIGPKFGVVIARSSQSFCQNSVLGTGLLLTMNYGTLASCLFLQVIRDSFLRFDESTVSRVVRRVTQALTTKLGDFERFPFTRAERGDIKEGLFRFGGFPYAIGFIDGTHVRMTAPQEMSRTS